ncbi:hypothetical protein GCM10010921_01070 [Microbacterium album]|uniref:Uncharacterized protein n=1 Tax=Microbacterium album TaxID=2053191 RepID=A0A917ICJ9_9MICO|nr:hypothetical protein [Microbacterium album]GGH33821.1 hypothetical protein GCM10010921_01070 [Microbacterium album]
MSAADDVFEEHLGVLELSALRADPSEPLFDDLGTARFIAVKHEPYLGEAHADALAGLDDAEATDVLLGVDPMARWGAIRDDHAHIVPVPQHVGVDADASRSLTDLHRCASFSLDFR